MISDVTIEQIKSVADCLDVCENLLSLTVKRVGGRSFISCPSHSGDNTPSCQVNKDFVYCYACQSQGDVFDLVCRVRGCSWWEAAKELCGFYGIAISDAKKAVELPILLLRSEALSLVGLKQKQLLKQLLAESPIFFWHFIEHETLTAITKSKTVHLPQLQEEKARRIKLMDELLKVARFAQNKKPGSYIVKISGEIKGGKIK